MPKYIGVAVVSCAFLGISFASYQASNVDATVSSIQQSEKIKAVVAVDDLIARADNIVIATVTDAEPFNDAGTYTCTLSLDQQLAGNEQTPTIDLYSAMGILEKGKQYLFFLEKWEGELYPRPVFNLVDDDSVVLMDGTDFTGSDLIRGEFADRKQAIAYIGKKAKKIVKANKAFDVKEKATTTEERIHLADQIATVIPQEIVLANKHVKFVKVNVTHPYKGTINEGDQLALPSSVEIGQEYVVFLRNKQGTIVPATRVGSVVSKANRAEWNKVMQSLR